MEETTTTIISALSTISPPQLSGLTHSILSSFCRHHRLLSTLLSSPTLFSLTLHHLHSLSLSSKTLLISRFLLSSLTLLTNPFSLLPHHSSTPSITSRDLDAALLLLLLCETRQHNPKALDTSPSKWRIILSDIWSDTMLSPSSLGIYSGSYLIPYIEMVVRCWGFVNGVVGSCGGGKVREVAASALAVVALPSVEVRERGVECVVCREEIEEGRDACELPCQHLFHWICILPWLRKRNSCPCCRFQLPTDDVFGEIQRLWDVLMKAGFRTLGGD